MILDSTIIEKCSKIYNEGIVKYEGDLTNLFFPIKVLPKGVLSPVIEWRDPKTDDTHSTSFMYNSKTPIRVPIEDGKQYTDDELKTLTDSLSLPTSIIIENNTVSQLLHLTDITESNSKRSVNLLMEPVYVNDFVEIFNYDPGIREVLVPKIYELARFLYRTTTYSRLLTDNNFDCPDVIIGGDLIICTWLQGMKFKTSSTKFNPKIRIVGSLHNDLKGKLFIGLSSDQLFGGFGTTFVNEVDLRINNDADLNANFLTAIPRYLHVCTTPLLAKLNITVITEEMRKR